MSATVRIALTPGCPAGIGPEVVAGALARAELDDESVRCQFLGPAGLLLRGAALLGIDAKELPGSVPLVRLSWQGRARDVECQAQRELSTLLPRLAQTAGPYGPPDEAALRFQRDALVSAARLAKAGEVQAIVTGPVRKRALTSDAGGTFPGQTELLHHHLAADDDEPLMCFTGGPFVLGLATVHVPLREVTTRLTKARVRLCLERLTAASRRVMSVEEPRIVVLGVNPHAGEGGLLGDDEARVLEPVLSEARARGVVVDGPLPADGFFASLKRRTPDAMPHGVLAMHHDQGLAPYKLLAAGQGVNLTWGLTVPRTSPDHGTADDIAGQGLADPSSTIAALELAARLALGA